MNKMTIPMPADLKATFKLLLLGQIRYAHSLDGVMGEEASIKRKEACAAVNCTLDIFTQWNEDAEEIFQQTWTEALK